MILQTCRSDPHNLGTVAVLNKTASSRKRHFLQTELISVRQIIEREIVHLI